ncbi:MAG: ATP-binding cassette domain-containing protein [Sphingomonadales bacterium]|nr:ATP-binding cassette domain-containing protein [Sphingomonadales bacterium]
MAEAAEHSFAAPRSRKRLVLSARWQRAALRTASIVLFFAIWFAGSWLNANVIKAFNPVLLPPPQVVLQTGIKLAASGELHTHILASMSRVIQGFILASVGGVLLGALVGRSRTLENLIEPMIELLRPIPPLAFLPMMVLWFGIGEMSKIAFIAYAAFFPIFTTTVEGIKYVDPILMRAAPASAPLSATSSATSSFRPPCPTSLPVCGSALRCRSSSSSRPSSLPRTQPRLPHQRCAHVLPRVADAAWCSRDRHHRLHREHRSAAPGEPAAALAQAGSELTPAMRSKIRIEGVSKQFDASVALQRVSLEIAENSFTCLLGPSGCGKSTLLNMIAGFVTPSSGRILVDGSEVRGASADRGVVFQEYALFPWRTTLQNVAFGPFIRGKPRAEQVETAQEYLKLVGLSGHEQKFPNELSGGMKQRVAIARALANHPSVLLMDEPFGALDAQTREVLQEEMLRIWQHERKTVIFVTHSISESIFLADCIVVMGTKPGSIKEVLDIDLKHPRDRTSPEFVALDRRIKQLVREEVEKLGVI